MKLIRDNIHNYIEDKSTVFQLERMNDLSLVEVLKDKLREETAEVIAATGDDLLIELADVYEVLRSICVHSGWTIGELHDAADNKRAHLGGFSNRWFLREDELKR